MINFYLRWGGLLIVAIVFGVLTYNYYQKNLASLSPSEVKRKAPIQEIRVSGMVKSGTLKGSVETGDVQFELIKNNSGIAIHYQGLPPDSLRELKTLVLIGKWSTADNIFNARDISLVPNYGFVIGAYLISTLPLVIFLFFMNRRVRILYEEIKITKIYQEE